MLICKLLIVVLSLVGLPCDKMHWIVSLSLVSKASTMNAKLSSHVLNNQDPESVSNQISRHTHTIMNAKIVSYSQCQ